MLLLKLLDVGELSPAWAAPRRPEGDVDDVASKLAELPAGAVEVGQLEVRGELTGRWADVEARRSRLRQRFEQERVLDAFAAALVAEHADAVEQEHGAAYNDDQAAERDEPVSQVDDPRPFGPL